MTERCPFCGGSGEIDGAAVGDVADVLSRPGSPSPHLLYEQTGGGEPYFRAMVQHGYVLVNGDVRCGVKQGTFPGNKQRCSCLLKKDHEGPHLCPHGEWTS